MLCGFEDLTQPVPQKWLLSKLRLFCSISASKMMFVLIFVLLLVFWFLSAPSCAVFVFDIVVVVVVVVVVAFGVVAFGVVALE